MASKRKSTQGSSGFNFRPPTENQKWETKGTKPLPKPVSVKEAILTMVIHGCRKILFMNTYIKVGLYLAGLFLSLVFDVTPFPKTYFSKSDNMFNLYFVKLGWGWTLMLTLPFVLLTSFTYCCGKRKLILMHLSRLGIATIVWFVFTKSFALIEQNFGRCTAKGDRFATKQLCISKGFYWHSLDISGHAFILIWSCLVIIEEARAIIGWETIKDLIRNEEHSRSTSEVDLSSPLKHLTDEEFEVLKSSHLKFSPYVRSLFIAMTVLTILWDVMIISTILYFHIMIEKLISGILAASVWFFTYRYWFAKTSFLPKAPGDGLFKYNQIKSSKASREPSFRSRGSVNSKASQRPGQLPTFMGMPLYGLRTQENKEDVSKDENVNSDPDLISNKPNTNADSRSVNNQSFSSLKQGVMTRSQAANFSRNSGNKTI